MFTKIKKWLNGEDSKPEPQVHEGNIVFVKTLDRRQLAYYLNLQESWRREMTRLEQRVYLLEQPK
jgi:hypothetical protein